MTFHSRPAAGPCSGWPRLALPGLALGLALCGCAGSPDGGPPSAAVAVPAGERGTAAARSTPAAGEHRERRSFPLRGQVVAVEDRGRRLTVRHDAIPGLMPAMTMPFPVRGRARGAPAAGDAIAARLVVTPSDSWLDEVRVVRRAPAAGVAPPPVAYAPRREGERLSEFRLTDQDGHAIRLRDLRGKAVAVTFIYTRCPLPNFCPLLSERFAEVQRQLLATPLRGRVALLSVSFDPEYDTPARLRDYARRFHADPGVWRLLTGTPHQVEALASQLGVIYAPDQGMINHNLETTVLDGDGRVIRRFSGNDWAVASLTVELERVAATETGRRGASLRAASPNGRAL